jgi:hypothetical protein
MYVKMEKQIYNKPCLKVLLFVEDPIMGDATLSIFGQGEEGEFLSKEGTFDNSDFPNRLDSSNFPTRFKSVWDEE